ncbi:lipase 1 precursor [Xylariales sp. AK1849]|nr:lipase 1 precursor [Xylariales sp. AK1849]
MLSLIFFLIPALFGAALAAPQKQWTRLESDALPVPPKQDPWYTAPDGYEQATPGQVLRVRAAQGNLPASITNVLQAYNILYRSVDSRYQPSWAVTTLLVPKNPIKTGSPALLSYQIPYDSADLDAGPSYTLSNQAKAGHPAQNALTEIEESLGSGWYVTIPDYEGPLASFIAGVMSGHATLDAVRASLSGALGLPDLSGARYAMWGYSGGALASEWAAELQTQYAPELDFSGVAIGGLTPDCFNVFNTVTGHLSAGLVPPGVVGLVSQFPSVQDLLFAKLKPSGPQNATKFLSVRNLTIDEAAPEFAFEDIYGYFTGGINDFLDPVVQAVLTSDGQMGNHGTPQMPLFVYKAIADEISPVQDTDDLVQKYCADNATIVYERNTVGSHKNEQDNASPYAFAFLTQVLAGKYDPPAKCVIKNVTQGRAGGGGGSPRSPSATVSPLVFAD